ncbi:MAG: Gldg family protein [Alphaproteobacteria bacterium]
MQRNVQAPLALFLTAILFLAVNVLSNATLYSARFDLTQDRLFTLSDGTRNVLAGLNEPVRMQFFYSERLARNVPGAQIYGQRVRDMLKEMEANSSGNLLLEIIDPEPFSETEERAAALGLQGLPTQQGEKFFLGLSAANMVDGVEAIPFFTQDREQFLEYDLTRLVSKLSTAKKPKIGVLSGLPLDIGKGGIEAVMRGEIKPFMLYQQMRDNFDVEMLTGQFTDIADSFNVVMIVHPREMDAFTRYAIDQYVLRGGHVIAFTDPISEVAKPPARTKNPLTSREASSPSSSMPELYRAWGLEMNPNRVVADRGFGQRVVVDNLGEQQDTTYVAWLGLHEAALDRADPVTGELRYITMAMAGHLKKLPGATTTFTPLITSSNDAALIDATMMLRRAPNPIDMLRAFKPTGERYVLAARLSGEAASAFPNGPPPLPKDAPPELVQGVKNLAPHLAKSVQGVNVIAVADTDMWDDKWWVEVSEYRGQQVAVPTSDNANLVMAAIDNMTGSGDLISLRSRSKSARPFLVVQELMRAAEARYLEEEQSLKTQLQATEQRLAQMERPEAGMPKPEGGAGESLVTPEQDAEIQRAREQITQTRAALRKVQHSLRSDVESLQDRLRFINIALTPFLAGVVAILLAQWRNQRRRIRSAQWRNARLLQAGGEP